MNYKKNTISLFTPEEAADYNDIANNFFTPIYPYIASQILQCCRKNDGICLDLGTGPGNLSIEIAKLTDLNIFAIDISENILDFAKRNINLANMKRRINPIITDVKTIPLKNSTIDLIVSRGSLFAWEKKSAIYEIYRVLKPGGNAYIGVGLGSKELSQQIADKMIQHKKYWKKQPSRKLKVNRHREFIKIFSELQICNYKIINDDSGFWIYIEKI